jgi:DNA end-binding protein Ku
MFYPDEIRSGQALTGITGEHQVDARELDMAKMLVRGLTAPFDASKYQSDYRARLRELIQAKIEGQEITEAPRPEMGRVIDLMEALRRSVEAVQQDRGAGLGQAPGAVGGTPFGPPSREVAPPPDVRWTPGPR